MIKNGVKYIGKGDFIPGIPARDLNAAEVKEYGLERLLESGLYREIKPRSKKAEPRSSRDNKMLDPLEENKSIDPEQE